MKVRWLLPGDILWDSGLDVPTKLKELPAFLRFGGTGYDVLPLRDTMPALGAIIEGLKSMMSKERRSHAFDRGW